MIIRINSIESTIEVFHEHYLHLHGFLKISAQDKKIIKSIRLSFKFLTCKQSQIT